MNYTETINYIHNTPKFSRVLGNDLLRKLLDKLGNPQKDLKFIHIAGTNGKGSAAIMLAQILTLSGYKTGLFTSPYIEVFNERIKVDGEIIDNKSLAEITTKIRNTIETYDTPVSEFALDTAIAFEYFKKQNCDIVVLETGLGGRLDATNVIDNAILTILMSIGLDHTQYLGETIEEITAEKCGIIKENNKVIVYPIQETGAKCVIEKFCKAKNADLIYAQTPKLLDGNNFEYKNEEYSLGLNGDFQKYNAATVLAAIDELKKTDFSISDKAIKSGLLSAFNPARLEKLDCGLIIDGAHNTPAAKALCKNLINMPGPIFLCIAMMEDKDIYSCIAEFAKLNPTVIATEINMPRCAKAESIVAEFAKYGVNATICKDPVSAAKTALKLAESDGTAVVCGSLYLAGIVRKNLKNNCSKPYYVYMLRCSDNSLYTGITTNVERRFEEHKEKHKKGAKYTAAHTPLSIEAVWEVPDRSSASKLESQIKKLSKSKKEELILTKKTP